MNQNESQPSFELPPVQQDAAPGASFELPPAGPETNTSPGMPPATNSATTQPPAPQAWVPDPALQAASPVPASQGTPQVADDNDLIEKEWVQKAKQIVAATKEDPYVQNRELSRFKADYLKKRYNKDIKIEEA